METLFNTLLALIGFGFGIASIWHAWVSRNDRRDPAHSQGRR